MTDESLFGPGSDHALPDQSEPKPRAGGWPEFRDARLSKFLQAYLEFGPAGQVPERAAIDPVQLGPLLSHVWLYSHDRDQDRFFCEIVGENAKGAWQRPMMKQWADDIFDVADLAQITFRWKRVMAESLVLHASYSEPKRFRHAERVAVPIVGADGAAIYVFGMSTYERLTSEDKQQAPAALESVIYYRFSGLTSPDEE